MLRLRFKIATAPIGSGAELADASPLRLEAATKPDTAREVGGTRSSTRSSDGCPIAYVAYPARGGVAAEKAERGGTRWLVLSNSLGTSAELWAPQLEALRARFHVLCYDSRGHGASGAPPGPYSIERLAEDALTLLDALGIERAHFCGLSKGGMVGQWLGANAPQRIDRLVLANTAASLGPASAWQERIELVLARGMESVVETALGRWFTPAFRQSAAKQVEAARAMLLATPAAGYAGCCAALRDLDLRASASRITAPTLLVAGAFDPATPPERLRELAAAISGSKLVELAAAHLSNIEQPEAFNRAVLEFLK